MAKESKYIRIDKLKVGDWCMSHGSIYVATEGYAIWYRDKKRVRARNMLLAVPGLYSDGPGSFWISCAIKVVKIDNPFPKVFLEWKVQNLPGEIKLGIRRARRRLIKN